MAQMMNVSEGYVDWRNKPAIRGRHGGILAASFVCAVEILENLAYLANASNLVIYLTKFMHFSPSASANMVTNFMGTAFLLALVGGFLSDAFFTTYRIYLVGAAIEFVGLLILTVQAHMDSLEPPKCIKTGGSCEEANGRGAMILFAGLYLVALGVGGIKGSLPAHGAEQFDAETPQGRKQRSAFFNYFVFSLACGALMAVTLVVWIEDNKGWQWGFGIATAAILISILIFLVGSTFYRNKVPTGSPITIILKVLIAALRNTRISVNHWNGGKTTGLNPNNQTDPVEAYASSEKGLVAGRVTSTELLNRTSTDKPANLRQTCTGDQIEEVKIVVKILPIFASTVVLNCCLAQLSTFSVQQAATMNTKLGSWTIPPASLPVFPVLLMVILVPLYNHVLIPLVRKIDRTEMGITHLQRIGTGLIFSVVAMAVAALVEIRRKRVAEEHGLLHSTKKPLPMTFLWVALQYLFLGSADLFTLAGVMEFFFTEAPTSMRSLATSLSWTSLAMGYYLSSVLVSLVNSITGKYHHQRPWLSGSNLNHCHLERFYWLMCAVSAVNFLLYLFWANRYTYRPKISEN